MPTDIPLLLQLGAGLLVAGLVAGVLAGLLGVGGGIVLVPVLHYVLGVVAGVEPEAIMHMAVGTSLASMIPTSIRSALAHRRTGAVDVELFTRWAPLAIAGTMTGIGIAAWVKGPVLVTVFAVFASLAGLHMAFCKESWRIASELPGRMKQRFMAFSIASVSVMMGVGGGTFTVPALALFGYPIHRAVGTAAALGVLIAIPGGIGFAVSGLGVPGRPPGSMGYVSLVGVALIIPGSLLAAPWGARLAHWFDQKWLRRSFALFLGVTGVKMAFSLR